MSAVEGALAEKNKKTYRGEKTSSCGSNNAFNEREGLDFELWDDFVPEPEEAPLSLSACPPFEAGAPLPPAPMESGVLEPGGSASFPSARVKH